MTQASLDLPFLIASFRIASRYQQALSLLEQHRSWLAFPVDYFRWYAAHALILLAQGSASRAREHAQHAREAAAKEHSGFRYHPSLGWSATSMMIFVNSYRPPPPNQTM